MERVKPKLKRKRGFTRISSKRQITIPLAALEQTGLKPGDQLKVEVEGRNRLVLSRPVEIEVEARRKAIDETAGSLTGVYPPGYLDRLRDEWR